MKSKSWIGAVMCGREKIYTRCDRKSEWWRASGTSRIRRKDNLTRQAMYV